MSRFLVVLLLLPLAIRGQDSCEAPVNVRGLALCVAMVSGQMSGQYIGEVSSGGIGDASLVDAPHGTVVVSIAVSEGLVLAADSRTTSTTRVISDSTSKLFDVGSNGIATYGLAFLSDRNIASWIGDFREAHPEGDVKQTAEALRDFIAEPYDKRYPEEGDRPTLGFLIAGYEGGIGSVFRVLFPTARDPVLLHTTRNAGADWSGSTDVITRLILGYDPRLGALPLLTGQPAENTQRIRDQLLTLQYRIPFSALTLQDGIDLALFLVEATVQTQRFADGTIGNPGSIPNVGGAVDVLVVNPDELRWIRRKQLTAISN